MATTGAPSASTEHNWEGVDPLWKAQSGTGPGPAKPFTPFDSGRRLSRKPCYGGVFRLLGRFDRIERIPAVSGQRAALLVAAALLCVPTVAAAQQPFLPGQVRSEALAARTMHHACAWVGVASMTQAQITADTGHDAQEEDLGVAYSGQCRIGLTVDAIVGLGPRPL